MEDFTFSVKDIITFGSICAAIFSFIKLRKSVLKPRTDIINKVQNHEKRIAECEKKLNNDFSSMEEQHEINVITLKSLSALLSHSLDGNNIDEMNECKKEIKDRLYNAGGSIR